jgi:hypothetical protein
MERSERSASVQRLVDGLTHTDDDRVASTVLVGRAVSRSAENIHLAVSGGIVAIPIANIEDVAFISGSQPDSVRMVVRDPAAIQPLLRTNKGGTAPDGSRTPDDARNANTVLTDRTVTVYEGVATCTYTETDTITGLHGEPDNCDDSERGSCPADDTYE